MKSTLKRRDFLGTATVGLLAFSQKLALAKPSVSGTDIIVETAAGKIRGREVSGIKEFLGVHYGESTAGRRFQRGIQPKPWKGVRDALEYGPRSPFIHAKSLATDLIDWNDTPGPESDDCLDLNIWTPGVKDHQKRPVMFWLHGGGFTTGCGSYASTNGAHLARRGDVVVVAINHRLGFLGFLDLSRIGGEKYAESGNVSMLDAVLALQWVRDNIAQFGGDPNRVMIFGESGGGAKVCTLLTMPDAKGLFHRAAIESGAWLRSSTPDAAAQRADTFLTELGLNKSNFEDIQQMPLERLLAAQLALAQKRVVTAWEPTVDGKVLPQNQFIPRASDVSADVPVLIGNNKTEATFFELADLEKIQALDDAGLKQRLKRVLNDSTDRVVSIYKGYYPKADSGELYVQIATDAGLWMNDVTIAERRLALGKAPVYTYVFDWRTPVMDGKLRSPHGIEIPFVFDNTDIGPQFIGTGADKAPLAAKVSAAWIAFAKTGNPSTPDLHWDAYTLDNRATMILNTNSRMMKDPWSEARAIYAALPRTGPGTGV
jgi:para-nitrobenzyl esterase